MVEQENMKVYELAKELGITPPLALVDKLKALGINVKSHMSELEPEQVQTARATLGAKKVEAPAKKTAARVRKKPAEGETAAPKTAAAKASTPTTKTVAAKTTTAKGAGATAAGPATPAPDASKSASPIIRRRTKADGETETSLPASHARLMAQEETPPEETVSQDFSPQMSEDEFEAATQQPVDQADEATSDATSASASEQIGEPEAGAPAARTRAPVVLPPRPVAPRKSFLKIVEPTAPTKPTVIQAAPPAGTTVVRPNAMRGTTTQDKDGFRIIKMSKENLDQMVEEEAAKKRGGGREQEIRPEDVRFADYRKKEMVFLPKKKKIPLGKELKRTEITTPSAQKRVIKMENTISVADLANQMGIKANEVIRKLMGMGTMATINQSIDFDTASVIASEYQFELKNVSFQEEQLIEKAPEDSEDSLKGRPPIVTIMGHVDHGKTSLLDAIRDAKVAAGEAGGITQHIGAYTVDQGGQKITFIDTPGHEAFTVMRARGANVTDIVVLVVAADDGVMPQTREALSHAKAAGVPIVVAMNKIDKPQANPEKIKQQLAELDLLSEDWGGQTMFVPVSAIKKTNLDKLLEAILLNAEVLDLKANPEARAQGSVLEARLEKGRGPVVSLLVKRGTLRVGDAVVSGMFAGRVKAMMDHLGKSVKEVLPGMAAEVSGFEGLPNAGERFDSPATEADAREIAKNRDLKVKASQAAPAGSKVSLEDLFSKIQQGNLKELPIILKADVFGSAEAVRDSLVKLSNEKVKVKVIHAAPGGVTESDVLLAGASNALILAFNVRPETKARQMAAAEHIEIKTYNIIYELIDDVKKAMAGLLDKKKVERFLGRAEVRQTFTVPKIGTIAGTAVIDGKIVRGANVRLLRDSRIIFEGKMSSLKRFKDDAKEVAQGFECGIGIENYNDLKPGDLIEAYQIDMVAQEMEG